MTRNIALSIVGVLLVAGVAGYKIWSKSRARDSASSDPVYEYVSANREKLREQIEESKNYEQRRADERARETQDIEDAIAREPDNAEPLIQRAIKRSYAQDHEGALRDIEAAIPLDSSRRSYLLYMRHTQLDALGRQDEALADVLEAIQLAKPGSDYHRSAADLYLRKGDPVAGVAVFDEGLRRHPDDLTIRVSRAKFLAALGRHEEAYRDVTVALDRQTDDNQRYFLLLDRTEYLTALQRFDEALKDANQLLKQHPDDTVVLHKRGDVYKAMGDERRAQADYDKAMHLTMDR